MMTEKTNTTFRVIINNNSNLKVQATKCNGQQYTKITVLSYLRYGEMIAKNKAAAYEVMSLYCDCVRQSLLTCDGYEC